MNDFLEQMEKRDKREKDNTKYYVYILLGLLPMFFIFGIALYFLVANLGYKTIFGALYLGFGAIAYAGAMNQINSQ